MKSNKIIILSDGRVLKKNRIVQELRNVVVIILMIALALTYSSLESVRVSESLLQQDKSALILQVNGLTEVQEQNVKLIEELKNHQTELESRIQVLSERLKTLEEDN